jgi:hypothetical protein
MKHTILTHAQGTTRIPKNIQADVTNAIENIRLAPGALSTKALRDAVTKRLVKAGWSGEVPVASGSKITITSKKQRTGLCLQTGNIARIYADLMKLLALYHNDVINFAIILIPSKALAKKINSNLANSDRLMRELEIFRKVYTLPTIVFSLESN